MGLKVLLDQISSSGALVFRVHAASVSDGNKITTGDRKSPFSKAAHEAMFSK